MKKNKKVASNVVEYIESFPKSIQSQLKKLRAAIKKAAPKAQESISYGMPAYTHGRKLAYFAAYKNHIGFYPMPATIQAFKSNLVNYKTSRGTVQFQLNQKLPLSLVAKMIKYRVKQENMRLKGNSTLFSHKQT